MLSDLHNTFFADLLDGVAGRAGERGYKAMLNTGNRAASGEAVAIETLLELRSDGLILAAPRLDAARIAEAARSVPVVVVARTLAGSRVDCVSNDDPAGAALAVDHLVALGHRRIAHIDGGQGAGAQARRQGFVRTMRRHGLAGQARTARGDYTEEGGARGVAALLAQGTRPTAIFAANDLSAIGALDALTRRGLRVPEDISLVGYDNTSLAALRHIDLTTIDQPRRDMGVTAVRLLLERRDEDRRAARHLVVPPSLVVRGSTGAPPS
jgi:DNA-binding LacI/PurR family transcriptional regulator